VLSNVPRHADKTNVAASSGNGLGRRIHYVDGLRAVAVLGVVADHSAKWDVSLGQGALQHFFSEGAHGVDLFFVLSGFCLSYPLLRQLHLRGSAAFDIAGYMARRIVRILPPYYFAIAVLGLLLVALPHLGVSVPPTFSMSRIGWLDVGKQAIFADRRPVFVNPSFWTLAIEWRWYFLFPLALVLWTRSWRAFVFVAIACGVVVALTRVGGFDLPVLPAFLLGIVAAEIELVQPTVGRIAALLCILSIGIAVLLEPHYVLGFYLQQQPGWQLAAFFFVLAAGAIPWLRALLSVRPLVWIGIASYSIYLVHEPIIATIEQATPMNGLEAAALGVASGAAFWLVFERPFMMRGLKGRLVAFLAPKLEAAMAFVGIPPRIDLHRAAPQAAPPARQPSGPKSPELVETRS
jgi:peptidoglycan/LPS O-acetylase OafA/YrhL